MPAQQRGASGPERGAYIRLDDTQRPRSAVAGRDHRAPFGSTSAAALGV
eukprot:COSAG06_NODE_47782_length_337_cov_0.432773_1_plen_48_part_10